jgi:hypothetical protein
MYSYVCVAPTYLFYAYLLSAHLLIPFPHWWTICPISVMNDIEMSSISEPLISG